MRDFHPERTTHEKTETTYKQTLEGSSQFKRQWALQHKKESALIIQHEHGFIAISYFAVQQLSQLCYAGIFPLNVY